MKVNVDGVVVDYDVTGSRGAPAVLLSHSLGTDRYMWDAQVSDLGDEYRLILVDTLGHGRSDAPPEERPTIGQLASHVLAAVDAEGIDRFHVCGVSMGGQVALWVASHHPDRVLSMTAANTGARIGSAEGWTARIEAIRAHGMEGMADEIVARFFSSDFSARDPARWERVYRTFVATDAGGYIACCEALGAADLTDDLSRISARSLIIGGTDDVSTPPELAHALHAGIPHSELEILEGAGHLSNLDAADAFNQRLLAFLAEA